MFSQDYQRENRFWDMFDNEYNDDFLRIFMRISSFAFILYISARNDE